MASEPAQHTNERGSEHDLKAIFAPVAREEGPHTSYARVALTLGCQPMPAPEAKSSPSLHGPVRSHAPGIAPPPIFRCPATERVRGIGERPQLLRAIRTRSARSSWPRSRCRSATTPSSCRSGNACFRRNRVGEGEARPTGRTRTVKGSKTGVVRPAARSARTRPRRRRRQGRRLSFDFPGPV